MINWPCLICERGSRLSTLNIKANVYANSTFMWYNHGTYWRSRRDCNSFILRTCCLVCYYYYQLEKCFCIPSLIGFDPLGDRLFRVKQLTLEVCYYLLIFTDVSDWRGWGNQANYGLSTTHKMVTFPKGWLWGLHCIHLFRERFSEKVHATIPKGILGGFEFTVLQRNLKDVTRSHRGLMFASAKGNNKSRFDSYSVRNSVLIICHITCRECQVQFFFPTIQNSCITKTE